MSNESNLSVGLELSIAVGVPATYDKAGFEALSWTEVTQVESVPEFGGSAQVSEFTPVKSGVVDKGKGSINYGDTSVPIRHKLTDDGQVALQSGFDGANKDAIHSVKLSHPQHGAIYFTALITRFTYNFSDANSWYMGNVSFAVKTKPLPSADVYTVTFIAGDNGSIIGQATQLVVSGSDTTAVYAAPDSGYNFTQWSDTSTVNPRTLTNVTEDTTLTATFTAA